MSKNLVETLLGGLVLAVAVGFVVFAYTSSSVATVSGYEVTAKFNRVDGLSNGADVRIGGIKVGSVVGQSLDPITFQAVLSMSLSDDIEIPSDSTAAVVSEGLLGGKFVDIQPGGNDALLTEGSEIIITQSSLLLEELIGKFAFGTN